MSRYRVLVLGGGGREHAIAWSLARDARCQRVFVAPGNGGTDGCHKCRNVPADVVDACDADSVLRFCAAERVDLVVIGPEEPLTLGLADRVRTAGVPCFGPSASAARIEASKAFSKGFMRRHGLPTARYAVFTDADSACHYIDTADFAALVVKASGLCAGKGVVVAGCKAEAKQAAVDMLTQRKYGQAGAEVVVEELLHGDEISVLCFTDGVAARLMPAACDHKRLCDGDKGPNTGGMGAFAPAPLLDADQTQYVKESIMQKTVDAMRADGCPFSGVLYAGLMVSPSGDINVLEFNARFGDPEAEVILPLLDCDLYPILMACSRPEQAAECGVKADNANGSWPELSQVGVEWRRDTFVCDVVVVSEGYPGSYDKGHEIAFQCGDLDVSSDLDSDEVIYFHAGTVFRNEQLVTAGGRVMNAVGLGSTLFDARQRAVKAACGVQFAGSHFRRDIASKFDRKSSAVLHTYASCGVSIERGDALVRRIKSACAATQLPGCSAALGGFGAMFDLRDAGFVDPVLVMGTDGVGTKLQIADECDKWDTIGVDLVAMCVNDIVCHGARPLAFLDYYVTGKLHVDKAARVIEGVARACGQAQCSLVGGETAEMPGVYAANQWDIAGFAVGAYDRATMPMGPLPRVDRIVPGCKLIVLPSTGMHSNGFSLLRTVVSHLGLKYSQSCPWDSSMTLGESVLAPTALYTDALRCLSESSCWRDVLALAHVTGGGIVDNLPRVLPDNVTAQLDATKWPMPPVFKWLRGAGNISTGEMCRAFNCGAGMLIVCGGDAADTCMRAIVRHTRIQCYLAGQIVHRAHGMERVEVSKLDEALCADHTFDAPVENGLSNGHDGVDKKRLAVLASGNGTNLQAIIDYAKGNVHCAYEVSLVLCNVRGARAMQRAERHGIKSLLVEHKRFGTRCAFDAAVHDALVSHGVELVALAGFMRILGADIVHQWHGRMVNTHPALLPSFKGANAVAQAIAAGVRYTGCTVHFVHAEVDSGAIVEQAVCSVACDDTEQGLADRIRSLEHRTLPKVLHQLATGVLYLDDSGRVVRTC